MDTFMQDVRYSVRQFARRPGFTAVAVLSLALAIGGNSLIFGLLDGFVFNPFRYPDPDRLVSIGATFPKLSADTTYVEALSPAEYADIRTAKSFSATASFDLGNRNVSGGEVPERVFTALLLDDLFRVIGLRPHSSRSSLVWQPACRRYKPTLNSPRSLRRCSRRTWRNSRSTKAGV